MMKDMYLEQIVKAGNDIVVNVFKSLTYLFAGLSFAGIVLIRSYIFFILFIIFLCLAVFVTRRLDLEYEYIFVNGDLSVDKIFSKQARKKFLTIEGDKVTSLMALERSHDRIADKIYKAADIKKGGTHYLIYQDNSMTKALLFTPNEELIKAYRDRYPNKCVL